MEKPNTDTNFKFQINRNTMLNRATKLISEILWFASQVFFQDMKEEYDIQLLEKGNLKTLIHRNSIPLQNFTVLFSVSVLENVHSRKTSSR